MQMLHALTGTPTCCHSSWARPPLLPALCLGHMLSANGAAVEAHALVRAPERFMTHEYFPIRLGAAELFTSLCAQPRPRTY